MKVQIEIDCSPAEARAFMGLPDISKANEAYVDTMTSAMKGVTNPDQLQDFAKQLAPMGQIGMKLFQNFVEGASAAGAAAQNAPKTDGKSKSD
ncbi:MAG: DUF6489 family protein [Parerythrobacter sp.]